MYECPSVRTSAEALSTQWEEFVDAFQALNRRWNDLQQLSAADTEGAEHHRRGQLTRLETAKKELIDKMTRELFFSRGELNHCPNK